MPLSIIEPLVMAERDLLERLAFGVRGGDMLGLLGSMGWKVGVRHHYVPRFLLRRWSVVDDHGQTKIPAYYWDQRQKRLRRFLGGENSFCNREALWALESHHPDGHDVLETHFFQRIDTAASAVMRKLIEHPSVGLSLGERIDWVRFLNSLDVRRPALVATVTTDGPAFYRAGFDRDESISELLRQTGSTETVTEAFERLSGAVVRDHALLLLQKLTDNEIVINRVARYHWTVYRLGAGQGTFVLGDRPLVRLNATDSKDNVWAIPLSPQVAFFASASAEVDANIARQAAKQLRNLLNSDSAIQCDRYVFSRDTDGLDWLARRLRAPARAPGPELLTELRRPE